MTAAELVAALEELTLTQTALARLLDLSDRTVRRYVAGTAPIPRAVELALASMRARAILPVVTAPALPAAGLDRAAIVRELGRDLGRPLPAPRPTPARPPPPVTLGDRYSVRAKRDGFQVFDSGLGKFLGDAFKTRGPAERKAEALNMSARLRAENGGKLPSSRAKK